MKSVFKVFTLVIVSLLLLVPKSVFADTYYAMIVRGGGNIVTSYDNGVLTVNLAGKARNAAGNPSNYGKLPVGSGA